MDLFLQVQAAAWTGLLRAQLKAAFTLIKSQAGSIFRKQLRSGTKQGAQSRTFSSAKALIAPRTMTTPWVKTTLCKAGAVQIVSISFNTKHHSLST